MASKAKSADLKIRKKKWLEIISPYFNSQNIGETCVFDSKDALKRNVRINLMNIIHDPRKQNIDMLFEIDQLKGETGVLASVKGYQIQEPSLRKLVRRGKMKVQDSFKCYTADKKPVVIKSFVITKSLVKQSICTRIRLTLRQLTVNLVAKRSFDDFIGDVIEGKFQKEVRDVVGKIYPIKILEYNTIKIISPIGSKFEKPGKIDEQLLQKSRGQEKEGEEAEAESTEEASEEKTEETVEEKPEEQPSEQAEAPKETEEQS